MNYPVMYKSKFITGDTVRSIVKYDPSKFMSLPNDIVYYVLETSKNNVSLIRIPPLNWSINEQSYWHIWFDVKEFKGARNLLLEKKIKLL